MDEEEGSIIFLPPNAKTKEGSLAEIRMRGKRGKDYYDRIKDVIARVLECRNEEEKKIADLFKAAYNIDDQKKPKLNGLDRNAVLSPSRPRRAVVTSSTASRSSSPEEEKPIQRRGRPSLSGTGVFDLSWKDGGSSYPKRTSQVGEEFQATDIPHAGTYTKGANSEL